MGRFPQRVRVVAVAVAGFTLAGIFGPAVASSDTQPLVSVTSADTVEGNNGAVTLRFAITLSTTSTGSVGVTFNTANGTATAPSDYVAVTQQVTFNPGEKTRRVSVNVRGDTTPEPHEYFIAYLTDVVGAIPFRDVAWGSIADDDPATTPAVRTVAGNGTYGCCGDGFMALGAEFVGPRAMATDNAGHVWFVDYDGGAVRRFVLGGTIAHIAGDGEGYGGDGGPARKATLDAPAGIALAPNGTIYIADSYNHRIRRIGPDGIITTIAGNGTGGSTGDEGPAKKAQVYWPSAIALDVAGNLFIADTGNNKIRKIDAAGVIHTVAGTGLGTDSADEQPATQAQLNAPEGIAVAPDGTIYIGDTGNHRVRRVDPAGVIHAFAGTGDNSSSGDGAPATQATLKYPRSVAVRGDGVVFVADFLANRIRRVDTDGMINAAVGTGAVGFTNDGADPKLMRLRGPGALMVDSLGRLFFDDDGNARIREVDAL